MLDKEKNKLFINGENKLDCEEYNITKIKYILKNYLELDNVSFLFGAGTSIILGGRSIRTIPLKIEEAIKPDTKAYEEFINILKQLQEQDDIKREQNGEIDYPLENLLNYLIAINFVKQEIKVPYEHVDPIIGIIKEALFNLCDIEKAPLPDSLLPDVSAKLKDNRYYYHEFFTKKLLQRQLNLKRANIFTTNYDLAFDTAFDNLGVNYISGFSGFHKRYFKPETFNYDIFFPGSTTQGKIERIEKVLRYFKIHGSLTWVGESPSPNCVYGIKELPIELIRKNKEYKNLIIYPTTVKKSYTLDYPYSELLRQFSTSISQPQSVLITFGYSFGDEHINDLIYQALTIPSFTLIIIDFKGTENPEIKRLCELKDPRVIIMQGKELGAFPFFVTKIMPDLIDIDTNEKISQSMQKILCTENKQEAPATPKQPSEAVTIVDDKPFQ